MKYLDYHKLYSSLGERIKKARGNTGITQQELAKLVKISRVSIVNIEKGRQRPPFHLIWEIADHLQVHISDLIPDRETVYSGSENQGLFQQAKAQTKGDPAAKKRVTDFIKSLTSES